MQKQWDITCKGKTLEELREALTDALAELNGLAVTKNVSVKKNLEEAKAWDDACLVKGQDELEDEAEEFTPENMIGKTLTQTAPVNMNELDSEGLPWIESIHTSAKTKVKNGSWKIKRGVDDATANKVKAEFRGATQSFQAPAVVAQPTQVITPVVQAPPVVAAPLPTMNSGHTAASFVSNFPLILGNLITQGKVNQDYVNQLKDYFKVTEIWMLNDQQKAEVFESFVGYGLIQKVG